MAEETAESPSMLDSNDIDHEVILPESEITIETEKTIEIFQGSDNSSNIESPASLETQEDPDDAVIIRNENEKTVSRELKSLLEATKEAKLETNLTHKRESLSRRDTKSPMIKGFVIKNDDAASDKRTMRSQNPEFAAKRKHFLAKITDSVVTDNDESSVDNVEVSINERGEKSQKKKIRSSSASPAGGASIDDRRNKKSKAFTEIISMKPGKDSFCWRCHNEDVSIHCDLCPRSYHLRCLKSSILNHERWHCPECLAILLADNIETRSPVMKDMPLHLLCELLKFAVKRMTQCPGAEPFIHAVDTKSFDNYYQFIINPMDMTKLQNNIKNNQYGSTVAFLADAKWILHNCIVYNSYQSKLTKVAKHLIKICKQEMSEIENCHECYLNANTKKNTWFVEVCSRPHILLWAKLKGFPYWPAKGMTINSSGQVDVRFFGAHDRAWIPIKDCFLYSQRDPNTTNKYKRENIAECIKEVDVHIENLRTKFDEFNYAPYRMPYNPLKEFEQLKLFLPKYKPEEKHVASFSILLDGLKVDLDTDRKRRSRSRSVSRQRAKSVSKTTDDGKRRSRSRSISRVREIKDVKPGEGENTRESRYRSRSKSSSIDQKSDRESGIITDRIMVVKTDVIHKMESIKQKQEEEGSSSTSKSDEVSLQCSNEEFDKFMEGYGTGEDEDDTSTPSAIKNVVEESESDSDESAISKHESETSSSLNGHQRPERVRTYSSRKRSLQTGSSSSAEEISTIKLMRRNSDISDSRRLLDKINKVDDIPETMEVSFSNDTNGALLSTPEKIINRTEDEFGKLKPVVVSAGELYDKDREIRISPQNKVFSIAETLMKRIVSPNSSDNSNESSKKTNVEKESAEAEKEETNNSVESLVELTTTSTTSATDESAAANPKTNKEDDNDTVHTNKHDKLKFLKQALQQNIPKGKESNPESVKLVNVSEILSGKSNDKVLEARKKQTTAPTNLEECIEIKDEPLTDEETDNHAEHAKKRPLETAEVDPNNKLKKANFQITDNMSRIIDLVATNKENDGEDNNQASNNSKQRARKSLPSPGKLMTLQVKKIFSQKVESKILSNPSSIKLKNVTSISEEAKEKSSGKSPVRPNTPNVNPLKKQPVVVITPTSTINLAASNHTNTTTPKSSSTSTETSSQNSNTTTNITTTTTSATSTTTTTINVNNNTIPLTIPTTTFTNLALLPRNQPLTFNPNLGSHLLTMVQNGLNSGIIIQNPNAAPSISAPVAVPIVQQPPTLETTPSTQQLSQDEQLLEEMQRSDVINDSITKAVGDIFLPNPPKLKPRPPGPLSNTFDEGVPSIAGPVTKHINSMAHRLSDYFRGLIKETLTDMGNQTCLEAKIRSLELEIEELKHKHAADLLEFRRNVGSVLKDIQKSVVEEKAKLVEETRAACEAERVRCVEEAKSKQWCAYCFKEAQFFCCWNTSYCDYPCQQKHWSTHMKTCSHSTMTGGSSSRSTSTPPPEKSTSSPQIVKTVSKNAYLNNNKATKQPVQQTKMIIKPTGKPVPMYVPVQKSGPQAGTGQQTITLIEATPGNFEIVGSTSVSGPVSVGAKFLPTTAIISKVKPGSIISMPTSCTTGGGTTTKTFVIAQKHQAKPAPMTTTNTESK